MTGNSYDNSKLSAPYPRALHSLHCMLANMQVNEYLPPERSLCVELEISRTTLRRALDYFQRQGVLKARQGCGTCLVRPVTTLPKFRGKPDLRFIGLVVPSVHEPYISRIVHGAEQYAADHGFHLALAYDHNDKDHQLRQLRKMTDGEVGGLAVYPAADNLQRTEYLNLLRYIDEKCIPLVMIDRYAPEIASACVLSDNFQGAYIATEHLILTGHRRLGLLAFGPEGGIADRDRRKGFLAALQDYRLPPKPVFEASLGVHHHEASAEKAVREWLDGGRGRPRFDGLCCMQDNMAYGAYMALRSAGVRVPEQVALVGYDNLNRELFRAAGLALTSIDQSAEKIGSEAARILISKLKETNLEIRDHHLLLSPRLVVRQSCGSHPSTRRLHRGSDLKLMEHI